MGKNETQTDCTTTCVAAKLRLCFPIGRKPQIPTQQQPITCQVPHAYLALIPVNLWKAATNRVNPIILKILILTDTNQLPTTIC